jgi:hypothetical protein
MRLQQSSAGIEAYHDRHVLLALSFSASHVAQLYASDRFQHARDPTLRYRQYSLAIYGYLLCTGPSSPISDPLMPAQRPLAVA